MIPTNVSDEMLFCRFFGGFGHGQEEEQAPRGEDVQVVLEATLEDIYIGKHMSITRTKAVFKPAPGKRQCNCRIKMVTKQMGPGMFQQYQKQVSSPLRFALPFFWSVLVLCMTA